jgi:hypothetical protein
MLTQFQPDHERRRLLTIERSEGTLGDASHVGQGGGSSGRGAPGSGKSPAPVAHHPYLQGGAGALKDPITGAPVTPSRSLSVRMEAPTGAPMGNSTVGDFITAQKYGLTTDQLIQAATGLGNQIADAGDVGVQDNLGNMLGKMLGENLTGLREINPATDDKILEKAWQDEMDAARMGKPLPDWENSAHYAFDPVTPAATVAGLFSPMPGTGMLLNAGDRLLGRPLEQDVGPNVLKPDETPDYLHSPPASSAAAVGGPGVAPGRSLPPGFRSASSGGFGVGASVPTSTPSAAVGSPASQPVQQAPAASTPASSSSATAPGQQAPGGRTVITGSNTVAWPWSTLNG